MKISIINLWFVVLLMAIIQNPIQISSRLSVEGNIWVSQQTRRPSTALLVVHRLHTITRLVSHLEVGHQTLHEQQ